MWPWTYKTKYKHTHEILNHTHRPVSSEWKKVANIIKEEYSCDNSNYLCIPEYLKLYFRLPVINFVCISEITTIFYRFNLELKCTNEIIHSFFWITTITLYIVYSVRFTFLEFPFSWNWVALVVSVEFLWSQNILPVARGFICNRIPQ